MLVVSQKDDAALAGLGVVLFAKAVGDQVFVEDVYLAVGVDPLDADGVFHGVGAAGAATIGDLLFWPLDALDHDHLLELPGGVDVLCQPFFELQLGDDAGVLAV